MLERYLPQGCIDKEEMDLKSIIRSSWRKLVDFAESVTDSLAEVQGSFKTQLLRDVREFTSDVAAFRRSFVAEGPMVAGIEPAEAVERLKRFSDEYEMRARKYEVYSGGEALFALKTTVYPELTSTKKELTLLEQLYGKWRRSSTLSPAAAPPPRCSVCDLLGLPLLLAALYATC